MLTHWYDHHPSCALCLTWKEGWQDLRSNSNLPIKKDLSHLRPLDLTFLPFFYCTLQWPKRYSKLPSILQLPNEKRLDSDLSVWLCIPSCFCILRSIQAVQMHLVISVVCSNHNIAVAPKRVGSGYDMLHKSDKERIPVKPFSSKIRIVPSLGFDKAVSRASFNAPK